MRIDRCPTCKRRLKRSSEANRRYWALLNLMAEKMRPEGQAYSVDNYHRWAKIKFLGCIEHKLPGGKTMTEPNSTADLDTAEFSDFMTKVEAFANEYGVFLEDME
jgi:hypothetical protein